MHRTTIALEGPIERAIRQLAMKERRSFKELINLLLKKALQGYRTEPKQATEFEWHTSDAKPVPGFDPSDRNTYLDLISRRFT